MKKYIAEGLGTFALALVVALSVQTGFPVATPLLAGLVLGLFVYTIGSISGTHINPAVTLGALSIGKITKRDAALYIVAQLVGGVLALLVIKLVFPNVGALGVVVNNSRALIAEFLGTFFFAFGIASVMYGKTSSALSGLVIGGSLVLGIAIAAMMGAAGFLNPAVALGARSLGIMYVLGPILGSVAGMQAYKYLMRN